MSEGLDKNPLPHEVVGRHEQCEVCALWFPEGEIEFLAGQFACVGCRKVARDRMSGKPGPRTEGIECAPLAWPEEDPDAGEGGES